MISSQVLDDAVAVLTLAREWMDPSTTLDPEELKVEYQVIADISGERRLVVLFAIAAWAAATMADGDPGWQQSIQDFRRMFDQVVDDREGDA